ncbi:hypothetical protein C8F04DRAFT_1240580 [Mycena alexandri]|uniref:Uncharacterized protein n=1 Tax=Mycena alexandri TaxID=1745969 RepID=A0AAD6S9C8_9AGAR|nr:hypothetical protein C8F04DRAFT_1240580 [Mycena alexandri]
MAHWQPVALRRILPKPVSQAQPEFLLTPTTLGTSNAREEPDLRLSWGALGQKRRREREARENVKPVACASSGSRRSMAQRARRQRELAAGIERDLTARQSNDEDVRSQAQKFRRKIEAAERRLDITPDCDTSQALDRILDLNINNFGSRRRESYRDRMRRLYYPGY